MTFNVLEEECRTPSFADTIGNLCDLEDGGHWSAILFYFARALQRCHPVTKMFVSQLFLRSENARIIRHGVGFAASGGDRLWISNFRFPIANLYPRPRRFVVSDLTNLLPLAVLISGGLRIQCV